MFGGVSPEEIILSQVVMLAAALLFASYGIFWSSMLRSSVASNVLTYGTMMFQLVGVPFLYFTIISILGAFAYNPAGGGITTEPAFYYFSGLVLSFQPIIAMGISDAFYARGDPLFIYTSTDILNGHTLWVMSPWLIFCLQALVLSTILILLSIRMIQPIRGRSRAQPVPQQEVAYAQEGVALSSLPPPPPPTSSLAEHTPLPLGPTTVHAPSPTAPTAPTVASTQEASPVDVPPPPVAGQG
jgi:hypothetical protein